MKKILTITLFALVWQCSLAQQVDHDSSHDEIQTISDSDQRHNGGFFAFKLSQTKFQNEHLHLASFKFAYVNNRILAIGFEATGLIPTNTIAGIVDNQRIIALGGYGGLFVEPIIASNSVVHVTFPLSAGAGWLGYHNDWEKDYQVVDYEGKLFDEDVFWYWEPSVSLEVNLSRTFRLTATAGHRFTQDLQLINTARNDFEGWNFGLGFKVGRF